VITALKQYLDLVKRRPGFVVGLLLVLAVAALCEVMGHTAWIGGSGGTDERELTRINS
jgi:hypothetical protein